MKKIILISGLLFFLIVLAIGLKMESEAEPAENIPDYKEINFKEIQENKSPEEGVEIYYYPHIKKLPKNIEELLYKTVLENLTTDDEKRFGVSFTDLQENIVQFTLISFDSIYFSEEAVGNDESSYVFLAIKENNKWLLSYEGGPNYLEILDKVPQDIINEKSKIILKEKSRWEKLSHSLASKTSAAELTNYKFPWKANDKWTWWTRSPYPTWHGGHDSRCTDYQTNPTIGKPPSCAIDFGANGVTDKTILASTAGAVQVRCLGNMTANVSIKDSNGITLQYFHLDKNTLNTTSFKDGYVEQGEVLGKVKVGDFSFSADGCGVSYGNTAGHLHLIIPTNGIILDSWLFSYHNSITKNSSGSTKIAGSSFLSTNGIDRCNPPPTGDWIINSKCTLDRYLKVPASVKIYDGGELALGNNGRLDIDLKYYKIIVSPKGKLTTQTNSSIY